MAFVWELTEETINMPLGCLQGESRNVKEALDIAWALEHCALVDFLFPVRTQVQRMWHI